MHSQDQATKTTNAELSHKILVEIEVLTDRCVDRHQRKVVNTECPAYCRLYS